MVVGDIVYNDDFCLDLIYEIYSDGKFLESNKKNRRRKPLDSVLDMAVERLMIVDNILVIYAK